MVANGVMGSCAQSPVLGPPPIGKKIDNYKSEKVISQYSGHLLAALTLYLPQVIKTEFLLTISTQYQPDK